MELVETITKSGSTDLVEVYNVGDFPYERLRSTRQKVRNNKMLDSYLVEFGTFDIETTTLEGKRNNKGKYVTPPSGFMYQWQACIAGIVVFGRRWEEFFKFIEELQKWLEFDSRNHFVIYVHNLGFESGFMYPFFEQYFGGEYEIFATAPHKPIRITCGNGIEFRCSWKLTNMSLYYATNTELSVTHIKAYGDLNYKKIRTANTRLTMKEKGYCVSDVLGLYEVILGLMAHEHDTLETIPMTSTGYPRRDCRRAARKAPKYREQIFKPCEITPEQYTLMKEAGRGGDTHASRYLAGRIVSGEGYDAVSEYPAMLLLYPEYPRTKYSPYGDIESREEFDKLCNNYACLFRITFEHLAIKAGRPMPYIPRSICREIPKGTVYDNGRVLSIPEKTCITMTLTEIDFRIIEQEYDFDGFIVYDMYTAKKDFLPRCLRDQIMQYFNRKCELKFQINQIEARIDAGEANLQEDLNRLNYLYMKIKNKLNGIFGMMYTDPVHEKLEMSSAGLWSTAEQDIGEMLKKYNSSRNSFLVYSWGHRCTALAREHLRKIQRCSNNLFYSDTDSAKAISFDDEKVKALNDSIIKRCEELGIYWKDPEGVKYYIGYFEKDGVYKKFVTLGAKKYAYIDEKKGELHVTVSGVSTAKAPGEKIGAGAKELKRIENFKPGFTFVKAGGASIWYQHAEPHYIEINGCKMLTASSVAVCDTSYKLGVTDEYRGLLSDTGIELEDYLDDSYYYEEDYK